ncbi:hypothetical protein BJI69_10935 [Luteibacter rhizovicinus DSM 16549]|uniref:Uncharacterized protein n=1 Tax=Luteibacter rhizovicinus DSM 16549 TaxID=1440763 RepID=A0A0G9HCM3_9GAMM|nr:DUF885 domain-containing protein [Luteibacter rhizovicinus]APG04360.1 hypothetical protein BJI69_10935 [Luteibacter rhizovicinus DSM 16549]KLD67383.1 hypothetical protein Y883_08390 [Luteibacter rhizovicinus DSM 16549]
MFRRLSLAAAIALTMGAAHAQDAKPADWIARSNADAQTLLDLTARFSPETATDIGVKGYDEKTADLGADTDKRQREALVAARAKYAQRLAEEKDPNVHQDLQILIKQIDGSIKGIDLNDKYLLPWYDAGQIVFSGEFSLLNEQSTPEQNQAALGRLKCYVGMTPGCKALVDEARARTSEKLGDKALLGPVRADVEQKLGNTQRYVDGIRKLFAEKKVAGSDEAMAKLDKQLKDYNAWVKKTVLPLARTDFRLPEPLYAYNLEQVGLDIAPRDLIGRAELEFMETTYALQALAPVVAKAEGLPEGDYRDVLKGLKKKQLAKDKVEPTYHEVLLKIEDAIRKQRIVELPQRQMAMRVASDAENARSPAPHMDPPPFVGNTGQRGTFVLTTGNPPKGGEKTQMYDDFTFEAAAWTLTAHEGRPGHELQFAAMVEQGVSLTRSLFAFNSVNVEGWALYSEMEMMPYEPPAGQFVALQFRLLRAARAFLDPMLNLGLIDRDRAHDILVNDVGLSEPLARQELDRYTLTSPGQATAYFYGYTRILQLRAETQVRLGKTFDRKAFNDFLIAQGLLPPDLLAEAVRTRFK